MSVDVYKIDGQTYSIKITGDDVQRLKSIIDHMYFALTDKGYIFPTEQLSNLPCVLNILERN